MKRKFLSILLAFVMTLTLLPTSLMAAEPTYGDTAGHWAESSIERWSEYGIIQGSNGEFDPNGQLTCAQLATILAKLLKLPAAKDAGFTDNTADAWYYDAINRCAAAGILNGNGDGTVTPEAPITRERAIVMLARALGIEPIRQPDLTKYTDAAKVAPYAQGMVAAMIEAGIVGGVTADELAPQDNINRASTVTILDRAISTYADEAGTTVKADGKGLVLVVAENVKITNAPEDTKIVVADGATGLTVNGKSVSDDQTYIVPKTTSSGSSSGGYSRSHSYDATTHKCSCGEVDPAYAVASVSGKNYLTLSEAITAAHSGNKPVTLAASKTTTETIQQILDGQHGSIDGLTIELPTGEYGALELGRATKYPGSGTTYHIGGFNESAMSFDDFYARKNDGTYSAGSYYIRSMSNVTFKAEAGATVNIAGVYASSGHIYGTSEKPVTDYVLNITTDSTDKSYHLAQKLSNITFEGMTFTAKSNIGTSQSETIIDGFTFKNCKFNIGNTTSGNQALNYSSEMNTGNVKRLTVDKCTFTDCYQGVYTRNVNTIMVTNCGFTTTGHNAIAIQDDFTFNHGAVVITGNTFENISDRIIRFGNVGADTRITITHNTATNSGDTNGQVIKAESLAEGAVCNIHDNSWGENQVNIPTTRVEMQAQIGEAQYATLAAALAAAKSGDTVKLVDNTTLASSVEINKNITLDLNGKTIHYTGENQNAANPTMSHRALNVTGGTVTIKNGAITTTVVGTIYPPQENPQADGSEFDAIIVKSDAVVTLEDMSITINDVRGSCLYVFDGGKATVKSGSYTNTNTSGDKLLLNQANVDTQLIFVEGGTFSGRSPAEGDDNKGGTFLAPGYTVDNNNGVYTVREATWNDYTADSFDVVPAGFSMTTEQIPEIVNVFPAYTKHTITISTPEALLYYGTKFNLEAAKTVEGNIFSNNQADKSGHVIEVKLGADIDLDDTALTAPLNIYAAAFDGCNKTISNATITNTTSGGNAGLFAVHGVTMNTFKDVTIKNITVVGGYEGNFNAGVVFGATSGTNVSNVTVIDSSVTGGKYTGAIVGYCYGNVNSCIVKDTTVNGGYKVGGIVGYTSTDEGAVQYREINGNTLNNVTVKATPVISGKTAVIGQVIGNWNALSGGSINSTTVENVTGANSLIGKIESVVPAFTIDGVTYVTVTPDTATTVQYGSTSNVTYLLTKGQYGDFSAYLRSSENVTFIADKDATFAKVEIGYHAGQDGSLAAKTNSTLTVRGFHVRGYLFIYAVDQKAVVEDNTAAQISVKTNVIENMDIQVNNNKLTGGDTSVAPQSYGIYIVPNISDYDLTITGNTFENIVKHAIGVQGCGDGQAVTAAKSITVEGNQFNSYGTDKDSRAAFKIWADTKYAPNDTDPLNDAAKALAASVQANNTFADTLDSSCILADFYGKTVPFSLTSPV